MGITLAIAALVFGEGVADAAAPMRRPLIDRDDVGRGQRHPNEQDSDKQDRFGGPGGPSCLFGLAGLKRRNDTNDAYFAAGPVALATRLPLGASAKLITGDSDD